jgi:putative ABC transport system permease protein
VASSGGWVCPASDRASSVRLASHNKAGLAYSLPEAYKVKIAALPHVVAVVPESYFGGIYHEVSDQFPNLAVDPEQIETMWPDWEIPAETYAQFMKIRTACIVGPATMKRFNLHVGQQISLRGTYYPFNVTLNIVGTMGGKAPPSFLIFRRDYLEEASGRPGFISILWVRGDSSRAVPQLMAAIDEQFANSPAETQSESEAAFIGSFIDSYRNFFRVSEALGLIVVLTIGLVAANTAAMSIRERHAEIAVMRSIGFSSRMILTLLLAESLVIGLVGGILGCGAAFMVLKVFSVALPAMGPLKTIQMPSIVMAETLAAAMLIGLLSGYVPARGPPQYRRRTQVGGLRWRYRSSTASEACSFAASPPR